MALNNTYSFKFEGGYQNSYNFDTDNFISYDIKFKPSDYIFEGRTPFYVPTFELSITVAVNETGKNPPLDLRVPYTIASIFLDFYKQNNGQVIVFICDSSDARQEVRRRKFNQWVELFKGNEYLKFDTKIIDPLGPIYYNSIILKTNNPYRDQIIQSFIDLADEQIK
jgi:Family of unknown function (DUF6169)